MDAQLLYKMIKSKTEYPLHKAIKVEREDVVFLYLIEMDAQVKSPHWFKELFLLYIPWYKKCKVLYVVNAISSDVFVWLMFCFRFYIGQLVVTQNTKISIIKINEIALRNEKYEFYLSDSHAKCIYLLFSIF